MKNTLLLITLFIATHSSIYAQTDSVYFTGFDNAAEQSGWEQFRTGPEVNPFYEWAYGTVNPYSAPNYLLHNYPVGGSDTTIDWYVSPPMLFENGGSIDSLRCEFSGFGVPQAGDTVGIYLLVGSKYPGLATEKILLVDFRDSLYSVGTGWNKIMDVDIPAKGDTCHIGFKYRTVANWLDVKFDNLAITQTLADTVDTLAPIGLTENPGSEPYVICNPVDEHIRFCSPNLPEYNSRILVYDVQGKLVLKQQLIGDNSIPFSFPRGSYYYSILTEDGKKTGSGKLIVN